MCSISSCTSHNAGNLNHKLRSRADHPWCVSTNLSFAETPQREGTASVSRRNVRVCGSMRNTSMSTRGAAADGRVFPCSRRLHMGTSAKRIFISPLPLRSAHACCLPTSAAFARCVRRRWLARRWTPRRPSLCSPRCDTLRAARSAIAAPPPRAGRAAAGLICRRHAGLVSPQVACAPADAAPAFFVRPRCETLLAARSAAAAPPPRAGRAAAGLICRRHAGARFAAGGLRARLAALRMPP